MTKVVTFLQGKKTYISAAALALVAVLGWWFGALSNANALAVLSAAGVAAGLGAKSERYGQLVLTALSNVRDAQAQHKPVDVKAVASEISKQIAPEVVNQIIAAAEKGDACTPNANVPITLPITVSAPPGHIPLIPMPPQCQHNLAKFIGDGKVQCLECGSVFTPTPEQIKAWAATAPRFAQHAMQAEGATNAK